MVPWPKVHSEESGFTLIELLVTMVILMVGIAGSVALVDGSNARTVVTKEREGGTALARELLESARSVKYTRLTPAGLKAELQALPGLADSTPGTVAWTVERRNQTYTVSVSVCSVDDQEDGLGDHTGANFCSAATANGDANPDDYKRISVDLDWTRAGHKRTLRQAGVVHNESSSLGPSIEMITQVPSENVITTNRSSVDFTWRTDEVAAAIRYSVDGVAKQSVKPSGLSSDFSWKIDSGGQHMPDGTYIVSATAFDDKGRPGASRSRTIRLNRDTPLAPQEFRGGWNARLGVVDVDWSRNEEPDITGYRVYRQYGATSEVVPGCNLTSKPDATTCTDMSPPATGDVVYFVRALDEDPSTGAPREGEKSSSFTTAKTANQPNMPGTLNASLDGVDLGLVWTLPPPVVPAYTGSAVSFYRIYRDGTGVTDRYARTSAATDLTFLDGGAAQGGHKYWVTAVDEAYSESEPVGPVSAP